MEWLGCGCLLALGGMALAVPIAIWIATITSRQKKQLSEVDLSLLSDADRIRWQSYDQQLQKNHALAPTQLAEVQRWPKRK